MHKSAQMDSPELSINGHVKAEPRSCLDRRQEYLPMAMGGRQPTVTEDVLESLSWALQLDDIERAHFRDLAAPTPRRRWSSCEVTQRPDPGMLRLMGTLAHVPVLLPGLLTWRHSFCGVRERF